MIDTGWFLMKFVMCFSLAGACLFGVLAFRKKRKLALLPPSVLLAILGSYEIYLDYWWSKTVTAPIRLDLFLTPGIVVVLWAWCMWVSRRPVEPS